MTVFTKPRYPASSLVLTNGHGLHIFLSTRTTKTMRTTEKVSNTMQSKEVSGVSTWTLLQKAGSIPMLPYGSRGSISCESWNAEWIRAHASGKTRFPVFCRGFIHMYVLILMLAKILVVSQLTRLADSRLPTTHQRGLSRPRREVKDARPGVFQSNHSIPVSTHIMSVQDH